MFRFVNADTAEVLTASPMSLTDKNLFSYCDDNPVNRFDTAGKIWDTVLDVVFIGVDIVSLCIDGGWKNWKNWAALGLDIVFTAVPFATGGGQAIKFANVGDKINDFSKITVVGETMDRVKTVSQFVNATDNLYDGFKSYNTLSNLGKSGKVLAEIAGKTSNASWLYGKLHKGYRIIDIGIDSKRIARSSSYALERFILTGWQYRNVAKGIMHYAMER